MRLLRVGSDSLLVEVSDTAAAMRLYDEALRREVKAADVVPAARTVLFAGVADLAHLENEVVSWEPERGADLPEGSGPLVEVPTTYDGPDLDTVARHWDLTTREVVALHTSEEMVVAFCGFAPGFAYCTGPALSRPVPRLDAPRTRVPAGSVGLADVFTGVYPSASPGGWQIIGHTDLRLWDETRDRPATLAPGTRVRFVEVPR
ncbi:MAG TPA: allophanate hydrolase subunit 1 [Nocardioidaceae bacterium]|nr:allophanate hydrolase subunit 1 [Nocardioidaceae bacterium]